MHDFFTYHRQELESYLHEYLRQQVERSSSQTWASDVFERLDSFVVRGKLLRGLLVFLAAHSFSDQDPTHVVDTAAAIELFHSGVLIHDDIIDQDQLRRGLPSIHAQYQAVAETQNFTSPKHTGESLAMCVGDICLFGSFELISRADVSLPQLKKIQQLFVRELIQVGLAEMDDVRMAVTPQPVSRDEILNMYAYKTGRYSIYLPLALGTLLVQENPAFLGTLEELGETMGILMQIKDDELGLFGTEAETGKPVTSDVREGKSTLYYLYAQQFATGKQQQLLTQYYGKPDLIAEELEIIRAVIIESGAAAKVQQEIDHLQQQSEKLVESLPISETLKPVWHELLHLQTARRK
jgi:geranylgeranyl diphosphate synthase type I